MFPDLKRIVFIDDDCVVQGKFYVVYIIKILKIRKPEKYAVVTLKF